MKSFSMNGFRAVAPVVTALLLPAGLWAGEALQFSNTRSHPDPNQKPTLPGAASRSGLNLSPRGPHVSPTLYQSRRRDPREERKAQNAEDEKRNWMVLDPGQLDAEDEDNAGFGIKDYDLDKKNAKRDYFFAPPEEKGNRAGHPRPPGNRLSGNKQAPPEANGKESPNDPEEESNSNGGQPVSKDGRPLGDHVSKDLDMKDLLAPGKANSIAPAEDRTTKLWKEILGSGAMTASRADGPGQKGDGSVADGFRPSDSGPSRPLDSGPTFGFRSDLNARPAPGSAPTLPGSASAGSTPPPAPLAPRVPDSYAGRPSAPPTADRVPTPSGSYGSYGRPSSFGPGPASSPYGQQPPPPRRPPSSGFEIPARPGYGGR